MTMKKKSAAKIFHIHKKAKEAPDGDVPPPNPPGSPSPLVPPTDEAESSTAQIRREAVEEHKRSSEFRALMDKAEAQSFVEGFYACRRWINYHSPQSELKCYTFNTIPSNFRYPPYNYLAEVERVLAEKEKEERREVEEDTEEAEEEEPPTDGEKVDKDLNSEGEEEEEEIEEEED